MNIILEVIMFNLVKSLEFDYLTSKAKKNILNLLFYSLIALGLIFNIYYGQFLSDSTVSFGYHTLSLFIPYFFSMVYIAFAIFFHKYNRSNFLLSVLLFFLLLLPILSFLSDPITYLQDDAARYSIYAQNMIENNTLWGSDGLLYPGVLNYVDQPGYRYWVALNRLIFGNETRGMQIFECVIHFLSVNILLLILKSRISTRDFKILVLYFLLSTPYTIKNILMGLTEWFLIVIFFLSIIFFLINKPILATIGCALMPFVRQNIFIFSFLFLLIIIFKYRNILLSLPYLVILFLPVYHNLYFANKFQLLVDGKGFITTIEYHNITIQKLIEFIPPFKLILPIFQRVIDYIGINNSVDLLGFLIAIVFVPIGTFLIISLLYRFSDLYLFYSLLIICSLVLPTLFFGWAYYPRFIYVNQTLSMLSLIIYYYYFQNTKHLNTLA
ncbi:hypothetical protein [Prochlorococcus marinus]|uniref:hypothetical protein n=1 Tax=Prochlorococcus marinus TaxID=1219 RepID=UPI0022B2ECA4|nr:hypothetical protein [Prochlorococcus marinus]